MLCYVCVVAPLNGGERYSLRVFLPTNVTSLTSRRLVLFYPRNLAYYAA